MRKNRWNKAMQKQFNEAVDRLLSRNLEYYDHRYTVHRDEVKQLRERINQFEENLIGTCRYLVSEELARVMFSGGLTKALDEMPMNHIRDTDKAIANFVLEIFKARGEKIASFIEKKRRRKNQ